MIVIFTWKRRYENADGNILVKMKPTTCTFIVMCQVGIASKPIYIHVLINFCLVYNVSKKTNTSTYTIKKPDDIHFQFHYKLDMKTQTISFDSID